MNHNGVFTLGFVGNDLRSGAHVDSPPPCSVGLDDTGTAIDDGSGRKIGAGDIFHQAINRDLRVVDERQAACHHLLEVVGRNIGGHAHRDARGAIDQQIGHSGR